MQEGFIMLNKIKKHFQRMPKGATLAIAFIASIVLASALFSIFRSSSKANDNLMPRAARVERVDGSVGLAHSQALEDQANLDWEEVNKNATLATGDRIYARQGSRATVAFTGRNYARLNSGSALDVLSLANHRTQLALRNGSAIFDVGELADGELFEVGTPNGAFDFNEPGLYQLGIGDDGNTWISVLSGLAQVVGLEGTGRVSRGEMLTLVGQAATQILLAKLSPDYAGSILDDYYGYRYPDVYDGRYSSYDAYLDDPYYYDTYSYRRSVSYQYVPDYIPGVYDLDTYGDWTDVDGYGHCWAPRVDADWVPYRDGYWDTGSIYGPTWISQEPWGWAPYHYGRWAYVNNRQWVWVPQVVEQPVYAPALVAFVPIPQSQQIGWVPLAPGEAYVPRCYDANFQPQYFASPREVARLMNVQQHYANLNYAQAVTVVPVQDFTRPVKSDFRVPFNSQTIAQVQPVLDPYSVEGVRNVARADENNGRGFKMARAFQNQVLNTPVVTSVQPTVLPGREKFAEAMQIATVPEQQRKNKLKVQDSGQVVTAYSKDGLARAAIPQADTSQALPNRKQQMMQDGNQQMQMQDRNQQIRELAQRSREGDRVARQELKRMAGIPVSPQQGATNPAIVQKQLERGQFNLIQNPSVADMTLNPRKLQKQLDRQQMSMGEQQRAQMQQSQELTRQQRKAQQRNENLMVQQQQSSAVQQETRKQQMQAAQQGAVAAQMNQRQAQKQAMREQRQLQQQGQAQANQQRLWKQQQMQQRQAQEQINQQQILKQQRRVQAQQAQQQIQQRQAQQQAAQQRQWKQQRQMQEQQIQRQQQAQQQVYQQRQMQQQMKQQRQMQEQQVRQQQMQQQMQQQRKAQRQQSPPPQVVQQQPQSRKPEGYLGPPVRSNPGAANQQRQAEKAQRKAGKGN
jgi:hypothetical protein